MCSSRARPLAHVRTRAVASPPPQVPATASRASPPAVAFHACSCRSSSSRACPRCCVLLHCCMSSLVAGLACAAQAVGLACAAQGNVWLRGSTGLGRDGLGMSIVWMRGSGVWVNPSEEYTHRVKTPPVPRNRTDGVSLSGMNALVARKKERERRCARSWTAHGRGWKEEGRHVEEVEDEGTRLG